jgi:hypothetical protein
MFSTNEYISLSAIFTLATVYFVRDMYIFNKAPTSIRKLSKTQIQVIFLYPFWIFLEWISAIQTRKQDLHFLIISTLGKHCIGFFVTVGILNDSFVITKQQLGAFFISMIITYIWAIYWYFIGKD